MLVIENCNSLSDLRQKLIDGEEVRTVRDETCEGAISRAKALEAIKKLPHAGWLVSTESVLNVLSDLPPVTPLEQEPKTGRWVYRIYGGFHEQGDWYCSKCDYPFNYGYGHAEYCPKCGCKMSETPTEEVIGDRDYDWVIRR